MIVVIADDLTGAAELGGLGRKYRLATEITTNLTPVSAADLLIIATNTRSLSRADAEAVISKVSSGLHRLQPSLVFKKIDSVLRGHVLAEVMMQQRRLGLPKALIIPANPKLGRTIVDGTYLLHGQPLHTSSFSQDPEFPVTSSLVPHMLAARESEVQVLKCHEIMPSAGIVVGEVKEVADLVAWCDRVDAHTLVAGASGFFDALLAMYHPLPAAPSAAMPGVAPQRPCLAIWGSAFHKSRAFVQQRAQEGFPVHYISAALMQNSPANGGDYQQWIAGVVQHLERQGQAGIALDPAIADHAVDPQVLKAFMADIAVQLTARTPVSELVIEGGATAAAVITALEIETLCPEAELAPGVIRMHVKEKNGLKLTLKPGSYEWPAHMFPDKQTEDIV